MKLTRRYFLRMCGGAAVAFTLSPMLGWTPAFGQEVVRRNKTLVVIFLRGGMDGLHLLVPYGDPAYVGLRPRIHMKAPTAAEADGKCLDLDGFFGLHPRAESLMEFFRRGELAILPAVGNPRNNRSHFTQQDTWETGVQEATVTADGWLNRYLQTSEGHGPLRAVSIGNSLPRILRGDAPATAIRRVADLAYNNRFGDAGRIEGALRELYGNQPPPTGEGNAMGDNNAGDMNAARDLVEEAGRSTMESLKALEQIARQEYVPDPAANYPARNGLAERLKGVAQLIKADVGLEVAEIDYGGWDTHQNQGDNITGYFGNKSAELADAMAAFARDLGDKLQDVMLVTMTEFGRTARENGTAGTDHGNACCMFALGGPVKLSGSGGRVVGEWPGLAEDQLNAKRDLKLTADFRDVFAEIVGQHLGNRNLGAILPGHTPTPIGLLREHQDF